MLYIKIHPLTLSMSRERSHDLQLLSTGSANVLIVVYVKKYFQLGN